MKEKYIDLLRNISFLTIGSFSTKLISFILVPIYTNVLTEKEYGVYDLLNLTISLLIPVLTLNIQESVLRFTLDKNNNSENIYNIGFRYVYKSVFFILAITFVLNISSFIFSKYSIEFFLLYCVTAFNGIITYYCRGKDEISLLTISSILSSFLLVVLNIIFLNIIQIGLTGYFWASIISISFQSIFLVNKLKVFKYSTLKVKVDEKLENDMTIYSKPMIINSISWWINNASDRYIVSWICGVAVNGIYSISYKIPTIMNVLLNIFGQAWTIAAVNQLDDDDRVNFVSTIYNVYNFALTVCCSFLLLANRPIARLLFKKSFFDAWQYSPFLILSTVFSGMSIFIGGIFSALKKSKVFAYTSFITALINCISNFILVSMIGPVGAAISTAISYFIMWGLRLKYVSREINFNICLKRDLIVYIVLILQAVVASNQSYSTYYQMFFLTVILILYCREIISVVKGSL